MDQDVIPPLKGGVARVLRICDARLAKRPVLEEDVEAVMAGIAEAARTGRSIDECLGLAPGWQRASLRIERDDILRELVLGIEAGSQRSRAREARREWLLALRRRVAGSPAKNEREALFDRLLEASGGQVPSADHIRKLVWPVGLSGGLSTTQPE